MNVAAAFGAAFGQLLEPAFATSTNAITAKTVIPKNTRVTFIELDVSSLDLPADRNSAVGNPVSTEGSVTDHQSLSTSAMSAW